MKWAEWPRIPRGQKRPRKLFHMSAMTSGERKTLLKQGWEAIDVRTMPRETNQEKQAAIQGWLEGVRVGSIAPDMEILRFIEIEAKICGLMTGKAAESPKEPEELNTDSLEALESLIQKRRI